MLRRDTINSSENRTAMSVRTGGGIKPSDPKKHSDLTRAKYYRNFPLEICVENSMLISFRDLLVQHPMSLGMTEGFLTPSQYN